MIHLIVLSLQSKLDEANNTILEELHKLSDVFSKLSSELSVRKNVMACCEAD